MEDEALLNCVHLADQMSTFVPILPDGRPDPKFPYDGMASAGVSWNPYERHWVGSATWSSNTRISGEPGETVFEAAVNLECRLRGELNALARKQAP